METIQCGILVLYSSLLVPGSTNQYGSANTNNTELTFTNINLKQILGANYDKYLNSHFIYA